MFNMKRLRAKLREVLIEHIRDSSYAVNILIKGVEIKEADGGVVGHCCFGKQQTIDREWEVGELDTTSLPSC